MNQTSDIFLFKITRIPDGAAPECVKAQWVGIELIGRRVRFPFFFDNIGQEMIIEFSGFMVHALDALAALHRKCPEAAQWFYDRIQQIEKELLYFNSEQTEIME